MTAIVLQARLDSTRLPRKALLDLGGKPVIVRVMENLARVDADVRILALRLSPRKKPLRLLQKKRGLPASRARKRMFSSVFASSSARQAPTTILRATGDNPYLFADAASRSLERFAELQNSADGADYFTFTGLPHGSGIEVFSARRLLEAAALTDSPWDPRTCRTCALQSSRPFRRGSRVRAHTMESSGSADDHRYARRLRARVRNRACSDAPKKDASRIVGGYSRRMALHIVPYPFRAGMRAGAGHRAHAGGSPFSRNRFRRIAAASCICRKARNRAPKGFAVRRSPSRRNFRFPHRSWSLTGFALPPAR